jgi:hypothetical protein
MLEWTENTPHVIVAESKSKALEIVESSAVCTSMAKGHCDLTPSEWLEVDWCHDKSRSLTSQAQIVCDALSFAYEEIRQCDSLAGFPSVSDRGWEYEIRLGCGDRIVSCKDDGMWRDLVERSQTRQDKASCDQVANLLVDCLKAFEWPHFAPESFCDEWSRMMIESSWIKDLISIERKVHEWSESDSRKDKDVWPFVVTRRTPVIVWMDDEKSHMLIRCKTIWRTRASRMHLPWTISMSNDSLVHKMMLIS